MRQLGQLLLVGLVLWAPLPFGSVTPWGVMVLSIAVAATFLFLLFAGSSATARESLRRVRTPLLALLGLGLLGVFQAVGELGPGWIPGVWSVAPDLSLEAGWAWWTATLMLALGALADLGGRSRQLLLSAAIAAALLQVLYGWRQLVAETGEIWGRVVPGPVGRLRGTFVNSDHLALLFELMLGVAVGWAWWAWRRSRREPRRERQLLLLAPPLLLWVVLWVSLVATGSRAALAAAVVAMVAAVAMIAGTRRWWIPVGLSAVLLLGAVVLVRQGPTDQLGRQLATPRYLIENSPRFDVWLPALSLWREAPLLGTGLGTFEEVFPRVQPVELTDARWDKAHNDPLELLVTGGALAVGLLILAAWSLVARLGHLYRRGVRSSARATALAALTALVAVGIHECLDFGLTIPANGLYLALLLGVAASSPTASEAGVAPLRAPARSGSPSGSRASDIPERPALPAE